MENQNINPQPAQPAPQQPRPVAPAAKPAAALPKDQSKANKRILIGCLGAFGCSILLFIAVLFAFLGFGSADNPIFGFLGTQSGEVVNTLITLINFIFLILVFVAFILVVIGVFKIATAKKDDKEAKRKGTIFTFGSLAAMFLLIFIWVTAYLFLASKRTPIVKNPIATVPAVTINLTAPVTITFDGSRAPINTRNFEILSYSWDFGDKTTAVAGNSQTHTFADIGNYKVTLTITAKEKTTGKEQGVQFTRDVTVQNVLAHVVIKADKTSGPAPLTVNLDGSDSSSSNGEIIAYAWDLNEDGFYNDGAEPIAQATLDKIGTYKVGLRVTDSTRQDATGEIQIEVTPPDAPTAVIKVDGIGSSTTLDAGKAYMFSGADSVSPTGRIDKYSWNFGDNGKAETRSATHTFTAPGEYEITLRVTDSKNKTGESSKHFTVKAPDAAPLISLRTTPAATNNIVSGQAPFNVIFDASQSQDANNNIIEYSWDFNGDGQMEDSNAVTSYTFQTAGTYNVSLAVMDSTNLSSHAQIVVQVAPAGLKADVTATPIAGTVPLTVRFDASGSSYPEGRIVSYEWDFGDGALPRTDTATVSHQYTAVGTFTAKVIAIGADNKRSTAQVAINVRSVPVKSCFEPSAESGTAPLEVEFDPTCSTGTVVRYNWRFANLGQSTERKPKFTFQNPGNYSVTLEVADSQNVIDTFTKQISLTAR